MVRVMLHALILHALILHALPLLSPVQADVVRQADPAQVSAIDAIDCRLDVPGYMQFAMALEGDEDLAAKRHWKKVTSRNSFMTEYELPAPITVAHRYATRRIAFTADAILAVLDLADPAVIAREEQVANTMNAEPLIADMVASGKASRAEAESAIKFRKFLGSRTIRDVTERASDGEGFGSHMTIARSISNATTHPGKTLYGCSYRLELLDKDGTPL